jgi:hypothetical protein
MGSSSSKTSMRSFLISGFFGRHVSHLILASFAKKSMEHCAIIFKKISGAEGKSIVLFSVLFVFAGKPKHDAQRGKTELFISKPAIFIR